MKKAFSIKQLRISWKQNKILKQILLSNTITAFLSVIAIGVILTETSKNFFYENFNNATASRLEKTASYTDEYMNSIFKIFRLAEVSNSRFNAYNRLSADKKNMLEFYEWLSDFSQYIASYDDISSMWIYNSGSVIDVLNRSSMVPYEFSEWDYFNSLIERAKNNYQYMLPFVCEYQDPDQPAQSAVSVISPLIPNDSAYIHGAVVINVNTENLKKTLLTKTDREAETSYIYNSTTGEIILSCSSGRSAGLLKASDIYNYLKNGSRKIQLDDKSYTFNTAPSEIFSEWTYISTYDCAALSRNLKHIISRIVIIVLLLGILELILSALLAFKIYIPINNCITNIKNMISAAPESEQGNNDELTTINKYIDNIEAENSLKDGIISKFIPSVKSFVLKNALNGCYKDVIALNTALTDCKTHFVYTDIIIAVILADNFRPELDTAAAEQRISDALRNSFPYFIGGHIKNDRFVYIINVPVKTNPEALNILNDICGEDMSFSEAVSEVFDDFGTAAEKYGAALDRCRGKFVNPPGTFYMPSENTGLLPAIDSKLINSVITEPEAAYTSILGKYLENPETFSCRSFLSFIDVLFNNLSVRLLQNKSSADLHEWHEALKNACLYENAESFRIHLNDLSAFLSETTFSKKKADLSVQVKKYIAENLDKDLSLTYLSDVFKKSPSYLSGLFKSENDIGLAEYINLARINEAKRLLEETNLPVNVISAKVGFINYSSFSRVFKKITGISASEYHKNHICDTQQ